MCSMAQSDRVPSLDDVAREQIRVWIGSMGITQAQLAAQIGRNQAWLSRYINGDFDADLDTLQEIAAVFGHTLTTLLGYPSADPEEAQILKLYRALRRPLRLTVRVLLDELTRGQKRRSHEPEQSRKRS